jgi:hypothetical protein
VPFSDVRRILNICGLRIGKGTRNTLRSHAPVSICPL